MSTSSLTLSQSIAAPSDGGNPRRKLLLVYIHGFMGDETSFRGFPAHIHSLLTVLLQDTHAVYTKIYPRYRSKKHISKARDDFSTWLTPHESAKTDVILLGHSMGGLLSAEVVLVPSGNEFTSFKHSILGTINFDVPFLGMHPGVVSSGLASIFVPSSEQPKDKYLIDSADGEIGTNSTIDEDGTVTMSPGDAFWQPTQEDHTFNAKFSNDVVLPARKFWEGLQHFVHKHSSDLTKATSNLLTSHVEFMSAMSNATELRNRYTKVRLLEEDNENIRRSVVKSIATPPRVRFLNYYTASTGYPKPPKSSEDTSNDAAETQPSIEGVVVATAELRSADDKQMQSAPDSKPPSVSETSSSRMTSHKKIRKFCNLPPHDSSGERDPTWVQIFMEGVDEVGAHCGMFYVDERYERLVADVAERIEAWVHEDMSVRLANGETEIREAITPSEKSGL